MATQRGRSWRSLGVIVVLIGGVWGGALLANANERSNARADCKRAQEPSVVVSPRATESPSASPSPSPSPESEVPCDEPGLVRLGLDLQGGLSVVLTPKEGQQVDSSSLEQATAIIQNRVDALGVSEPDISIQGENILIQIPGITRTQDALKLIGTTAKLSFRPVLQNVAEPGVDPDCADAETYPDDDPEKEVVYCLRFTSDAGEDAPRAEWPKFQLGVTALEGTDIASANAELPPTGGTWQVSLNLTGEGARKFQEITGKLACEQAEKRQLAIVLDQIIESAPQIAEDVQCNQGISGGTASITGTFSEREAKDLALVLRYGALPVELVATTTTTVSPTLGRESLRGGLYAGGIGLVILFVYMLFFYRALGLVVWIGLGLHAAFTLGVVILLGQTAGFSLTLAGVAGLIVSLGIATDSFIVYYERIKDELHSGRSVRGAVDRAWQSAWRTIIAADLVTALAAAVLYFLAVGSVRGFALMLGLATALDLFVSRLFMHPVVWLLGQTKQFNQSRLYGLRAVAGVGEAEPAVEGANP